MRKKIPWWSEEYGFFGPFYIEGDNSLEGYREKKQSLAERTAFEVKGITKLLSLNNKSKILDAPCGYGRHSIALAKKGFDVIGIDINSKHLAQARRKKSAVQFVKKNMLNINYKGAFDAVINMFYSFGFFETDEENERVLANFYRALKPGGRLLMHTDVNMPRIISGQYKTDEIRTLKSGKKLHIIDYYNKRTKRIDGVWIIVDKNSKQILKDYSVRVYAKSEFVELCKKAGFKKCKAYSYWDGSPYSKEAEDMIIVATK